MGGKEAVWFRSQEFTMEMLEKAGIPADDKDRLGYGELAGDSAPRFEQMYERLVEPLQALGFLAAKRQSFCAHLQHESGFSILVDIDNLFAGWQAGALAEAILTCTEGSGNYWSLYFKRLKELK